MRWLPLLALLAFPLRAAGECPAAASEQSSERALSDAPYQATPDQPCPPATAPALVPHERWTAERSDSNMTVVRVGGLGIGLGGLLLAVGVNFAICANHSPEGSRSFCHDARAPTLITGGALTAMGLGAMVYATLLRDDAPSASRPRGALVGARWVF